MATDKLEELNLSHDELKRISDAMKDEKFRKLFVEYAEEISNPENKRIYEEELTRLENDRGVDVTFINPTPGHVIKTSVDGDCKAFINVCQSDKIDKPRAERQQNGDGRNGVMWHIPHSFAPPREDRDKQGEKCQVYDVVFHPDTYRMAQSNVRFNKLVEDTAIDGVENQFSVKLDRKNLKHPKMKFKGTPTATVIRSKSKDPPPQLPKDDILKNMPPHPFSEKSEKDETSKKAKTEKTKTSDEDTSSATTPKYTIVHSSELDMQEYTNARDSRTSTRPKALIITIELPLLKSSKSINLDTFEQRLVLESKTPAEYKLDIALPYPVDNDEGSAKFDKSKSCLIVTLPVLPCKTPEIENQTDVDNDSNCGNTAIDARPLIEVLESTASATSTGTPDVTNDNDKSIDATKPDKTSSKSPKIMYSLPDFTFTQDLETVNFVIYVKNVTLENVSKSFPDLNSVDLKFLSVGSGGFPMHYRLFLQFPEGCEIAPEHCSVDVSDNNLVLLVLKSNISRNTWNWFKVGTDESCLEERFFVSESNLQSDLDILDHQAKEEIKNGDKPDIVVSEMNEKKLTIKLKKRHVDKEELEYEDAPTSAEIEVIHKVTPPKLHGILKQRTVSESSDDHNVSPTSESPRSDEDGNKLHKSVSFNSRVDSTSFHSNKCTQSIKVTLHQKRKKARRKERLQKERQRANSTGSEYSSGDDLPYGHTGSDCATTGEKSGEKDDVTEEVSKLAEAISNGFTNVQQAGTSNGKPGSMHKAASSDEESVKKNGCSNPQSCNNRTNGKKKRNKGKGKWNKGYEGTNKASNAALSTDSDENGFSRPKDLNTFPNGNSPTPAKPIPQDDSQNEQLTKLETVSQTSPTVDVGSNLKKIAVAPSSISQPGDLQRIAEHNDTPIVKVMGGVGGQNDSDDDIDSSNNEHRTKCAFQFSNSVIYDLDVE